MDIKEKQMLVISHIEPVGLIAETGSELATAFCNTYFVQAVNELAEQSDLESTHFMGSVAGQALLQMFQHVPLNQLDLILSQLRSFVIQTSELKAQEQSHD